LPKFNSHVGIERHETNDTEVAAIRVARPVLVQPHLCSMGSQLQTTSDSPT